MGLAPNLESFGFVCVFKWSILPSLVSDFLGFIFDGLFAFYWYPTDCRADMSDRYARGGLAGFGLGRAGPTKCLIERLFRLTAECGDSRTATPFFNFPCSLV